MKFKKEYVIDLIYILSLIFIISIDSNLLQKTKVYYEKEINHQYIEQISNENSILQEFEVSHRKLKGIYLWIVTDYADEQNRNLQTESKGTIIIRLMDSDKNVLDTVSFDVDDLNNEDIYIPMEHQLKQKSSYFIEVTGKDIYQDIFIYGSEYKGETYKNLYVNSNPVENLRMNIKFSFQIVDFFRIIILSTICVSILLLSCFANWKKDRIYLLVNLVLLIITPYLSYYLLERIQQNNIIHYNIKIQIANLIFYVCIYLCLCGWLNNIPIASLINMVIIYLIGITNFMIVKFRGVPICPWDIKSIKTALFVSKQYSVQLNSDQIFILLFILGFGVILINLRNSIIERRQYSKYFIVNIL